jgi:hypothetical protein
MQLATTPVEREAADAPLVGVWVADEGYQIVELLFRSDGRYQRDTKSTDPNLDYAFDERGRYVIEGQTLTVTPYEYLGEPSGKSYALALSGDSLSLTTLDFPVTQELRLKPGSREDVLARERVAPDLIRTWRRSITFYGTAEYTFRPGGYYLLKSTPEGGQFPPEYLRGRYTQDGPRLTLTPYGGVDATYEIDVFGSELTLIRREDYSGDSATYADVPGSAAEVRAKAAEAEAFRRREHWQVGVWEIRDALHTVDLTLRPDGHYSAKDDSEHLRGIVRGRYALEPERIRLVPFVGQDLYARSNGEFGKVERTRALDYYDGELQLIDLEAISQSVTIARKRPGSEAAVAERVRQAQVERARTGWHIGVWEVNDPAGWMELTYRPDGRYIAKSGTGGVPSQVERGRYRFGQDKVTLAPYSGLGAPRGFELDLYDGDCFLIGDRARMVVARKVPGSEIEVVERTRHPKAMEGERGSILGRWTANLPGQHAELVFRPDGEFRLRRCVSDAVSLDYGLYTADVSARTLVSDSRFVETQTHGLDFYGDTMTVFGGLGPPRTYTVNLGAVDAAVAASLAADAEEAQVDARWLARVPIGPRDPNAVQLPAGDVPADPHPDRRFEPATVFASFRFYRRLIPGFVYFNDRGTIRTVPVLNSREWSFFPTGRVLVRFRNHRAGGAYPTTAVDVSDTWGAYRIDPKPEQRDVLHRYADNALTIETDAGETAEMTLENGRRTLFWGRDFQLLSEWASEQQPVPCQPPAGADPSLMNTGVSLSTNIGPDDIPDEPPNQSPDEPGETPAPFTDAVGVWGFHDPREQ